MLMAKIKAVDAKDYIERGTGLQLTVAWVVFVFLSILLAIPTVGIGLLIGFAIWAIFYFARLRIAEASIKGSALRVGPKQFPDIYEMAEEIAEALDMETPEVYILESNTQNAFAIKHGGKRFVILVDDLIFGCQMTQNMDSLRFIIAHELAHHALGHTKLIRSQMRSVFMPLSRLDELSCDAVAAAVVGKEAAADALTLLLVGPHLYSQVNRPSLERQSIQVEESKYTKKAERPSTHPLLLRRLARMIPDDEAEVIED